MPGKLRDAPRRDWAIRFAFGAGVSALAAVVAWALLSGRVYLVARPGRTDT